jgi:5-deoxy-glucuronate isomerase
MTDLLVRRRDPDADGVVMDVSPASAHWRYVGFRVHQLAAGQSASGGEAGREACLVILAGRAEASAGDQVFHDVGGRMSVFEDAAPGAVYVPGGLSWRVTAATDVELAVCSAPSSGGRPARRIEPQAMKREVRGRGTNARFVRGILPETEAADSLLVSETLTPAGHWSSWPPHKHDADAGDQETALEETYYHRLRPPQGFAIQRVYTDDRSLDQTLAVEDGDVVLVPRGYHPVGAPHGYGLYYLNVMAGPRRQWIARNDPAHDWIVR